MLADFDIANGSRNDMFKLVDAIQKRNEHLNPEFKMFLDMELRSYHLNGFNLPEQLQQRLNEIHQRKMKLHS
jgi:Zn-dependent oligopeptidase